MSPEGQGDPVGRKGGKNRSVDKKSGGKAGGRLLAIIGLPLLLLIFVFNFTMFPMPMQIGLLVLGTIFAYAMAFRKRSSDSIARVAWLGVANVLVALGGYLYLEQTGHLAIREQMLSVMALVFLIWTLSGWIGRSRLITGGGWAGLLLICATALETGSNIAATSYGVQHLYWLLPAGLSFFVSFLFGRGGVYVAPVFLLFGLLALFGPDIRNLVYQLPMDLFVQGIVFIKLALLVSLLIVYRGSLRNWHEQLSL
ncbi:MAG TPA: hypothetical protein VFV52_16875 [Bacilli bacterium]|nr:hypothetical protein [Bacilli bacterium]